jgi:hypothetical protein
VGSERGEVVVREGEEGDGDGERDEKRERWREATPAYNAPLPPGPRAQGRGRRVCMAESTWQSRKVSRKVEVKCGVECGGGWWHF